MTEAEHIFKSVFYGNEGRREKHWWPSQKQTTIRENMSCKRKKTFLCKMFLEESNLLWTVPSREDEKKSAFSVRHLGSFYVEARVCLVMRFLIRLKRLNYVKWKYYKFRKKSSNGAIIINSKWSKVKRYRLFQYSDIFMTFKSHNWVQSFFIFFLLL